MKRLVWLLLIGVFAFGCSGVKVSIQMDEETDFSKYKSFDFHKWQRNSEEILSEEDRNMIESAFTKEFSDRNIEFKSGSGELILSMYIVIDTETNISGYSNHYGGTGGGWGYGPGWSWGHDPSGKNYKETEYLVGTLVCNAFDATSFQLVWQAVARGTMDQDPTTREENIPKAVATIMKKFPIKPVAE